MNRIDLFLNERELTRICKALRKAGAPGYSVMRHVTGMGHGGEISEAMDFTDLGANAHVVVFCRAGGAGGGEAEGAASAEALRGRGVRLPGRTILRIVTGPASQLGPVQGDGSKHPLTICVVTISFSYDNDSKP